MNKRKLVMIIIGVLFIGYVAIFNYVGCGGGGGSGSSTPPPKSLSITTKLATNINQTSATLNGTVNPNGVSTTIYFQYGIGIGYGSTTPYQNIGSGTSLINVSASLTGLTPNTTYNFRIRATRGGTTYNGTNQNFTTSGGIPPTCTTNPADSITLNSARLNGTVGPNGLNVTSCYFQWGTTTGYLGGSPTATPSTFGITSSVSANIISLSISTTYNFRVVATNAGGITSGNNLTFTTASPDSPP
ncbi:MAG: fibronectin type III domain-containing protein, partial [Planctomycetota bacterium]